MSEYPSYLIHYGIQGQKWGVRRFQNEDGTYTNEGLERRRDEHSSGKKIFKSGVKSTASGALETTAGTAKMAKAQVAIKKENDIKTDISKSGYNVDKWGYAKKEKNGMTYMFDTDKNTGDSREKLNTINNLEKSISVINKNLDKEVNRIIKDELDGWNIPEKHNIKLKSIFVYDKSTAEANYWDDSKNDPLGGHEITIEFDPKTKKYRMYSLNG